MSDLVRQAMHEGAFGVASALIYTPGTYASTHELIELSKAAGESGGMYISHLRSEGDRLVEAVDELVTIAREAKVPAEIYHLKAAGQVNWPKMDEAIRRVDAARAAGLQIGADMYTYTAGATGLDAAMPTWVQAGGYDEWRKRLMDPVIRARVLAEMRAPSDTWENLIRLAGSPDRVLLIGFKNEKLKPLTGKTLAEVARLRGTTPEEAAIDLVIEDGSRVATIYFLMSEDNLRKQIQQPWVTFGSDAESSAPEGVFLTSSTHPRAYGNFANLLGKYVREERVISLPEAVRRMTSLPAANLGIEGRGSLRPGYFADVVVFDPARVGAPATYEKPMQYATGINTVLVNGVEVLRDGEHTGAKPGRVVVRGARTR
jgi:N-acyl-D-amino-acid deacylase